MSFETKIAVRFGAGAFGRRRALMLLGALPALALVGRKTAAADRRPDTGAGPRHVVHRGWVLRADELGEVLGR